MHMAVGSRRHPDFAGQAIPWLQPLEIGGPRSVGVGTHIGLCWGCIVTTPRTLSVMEAARLLGVDRATLYRSLAAGDVQSFRVGRRILIPCRAVEDLLGERIPETATDTEYKK